jgi:hypothetical protein
VRTTVQAQRHSIPAVVLGLLAVGLALWLLPRCVQAEWVSLLFEEACYGPSSNEVSRVLALADEAFAIDREHYHFWALAADDAWNARRVAPRPEAEELLGRQAGQWCRKALDANPWHPKARVLWASIVAERDPREALRYWQTCVEWQYWEPFNHALMAELLGRSGEFALASNTLERIKGMPYYEATRGILERMKN